MARFIEMMRTPMSRASAASRAIRCRLRMLFNSDRLDREMGLAGLDGLIACSAANVCYLTDIRSIALSSFPHSPECFAVLSRSDAKRISFVSSFCEIDQVLDADPAVGQSPGTLRSLAARDQRSFASHSQGSTTEISPALSDTSASMSTAGRSIGPASSPLSRHRRPRTSRPLP